MITKDDAMLAVFQVCKDVYFDHKKDAQAARAWLLEVFKESDASDECKPGFLAAFRYIAAKRPRKIPKRYLAGGKRALSFPTGKGENRLAGRAGS